MSIASGDRGGRKSFGGDFPSSQKRRFEESFESKQTKKLKFGDDDEEEEEDVGTSSSFIKFHIPFGLTEALFFFAPFVL